jgi:hypothetical protein
MAERREGEEHRLAAEIANEPQWVVFDDAEGEDDWAARELATTVVVAAWWVLDRPKT